MFMRIQRNKSNKQQQETLQQQKTLQQLLLHRNIQKKIYQDTIRKKIYCYNGITREYNEDDYNTIDFITLTNTGYIDYTLNCYESLKHINLNIHLKSYCIGDLGCSILHSNNYQCELIDDTSSENFQTIANGNWNDIMFYKFDIIYKHLLNNKYVCITDGDIVYENNKIFDYLLDNIEDNELLIQSEGLYNDVLCAGFMFIKSNENTLTLFNPENVKKTRYDKDGNDKDWNDQIYVNSIKHKLKFKELPLQLFPTGNYYYRFYETIQPYLIHFNWVVGHEKKK